MRRRNPSQLFNRGFHGWIPLTALPEWFVSRLLTPEYRLLNPDF